VVATGKCASPDHNSPLLGTQRWCEFEGGPTPGDRSSAVPDATHHAPRPQRGSNAVFDDNDDRTDRSHMVSVQSVKNEPTSTVLDAVRSPPTSPRAAILLDTSLVLIETRQYGVSRLFSLKLQLTSAQVWSSSRGPPRSLYQDPRTNAGGRVEGAAGSGRCWVNGNGEADGQGSAGYEHSNTTFLRAETLIEGTQTPKLYPGSNLRTDK
jgi:hypothetical protein